MASQQRDNDSETDATGPSQRTTSRHTTGRPSTWRQIVLKVSLATLVTLVSAEGMLRVYVALRGWTPNCYAAQLHLFRPEPIAGYDLRPGFRLRSGVYSVSINSLGLRGPEVNRTKPSGVRRIAIVGESSAFGYLVSDGEEAARRLEKILAAEEHPIEVINAAVPGYNLFQSIERFREVVAPLKPDIVVAYLGWNDLPYVVSNDPGAENHRRRNSAPGWERWMGHSALYGFTVYRLWGGPVRMVPADFAGGEPTTAGIRQFHDNLATLAKQVQRAGATLVVCAQATAARPDVSPALRSALGSDAAKQADAIRLGEWLHRTLADFAAERHLTFVDAYTQIPPTTEMLADYVHLTTAGEERLAQLWADALDADVSDVSESNLGYDTRSVDDRLHEAGREATISDTVQGH
ncbi:MAG TPA: GDSL-type esterase/lipase family protein [Pirellulales bacterium]|nr:GDSL-type esterase/lipase family protein [Pirellulales bacterium]